MNYKDIADGENVLDSMLTGESLIPIDLKIEVYYNPYGTSSGNSKGYSEYYIIDKEISCNQLIKAVENKGDLKVYDGKVEILKNEDDSDTYYPISSILCDEPEDKTSKIENNAYSRQYLLRQLQELQGDFEDFSDKELVEHRECMLERINNCLKELGECDEDNI